MEKICILCKHWYFSSGEPGYSEYTPGADSDTGCYKDHWEIRTYYDETKEYRQKLLSAQTCPDFSLSDDAKESLKNANNRNV